jgi:hypothetical protein
MSNHNLALQRFGGVSHMVSSRMADVLREDWIGAEAVLRTSDSACFPTLFAQGRLRRADVAEIFPHWFCDCFLVYVFPDTVGCLEPSDQLLSSMAGIAATTADG